jgi:acyl carrier protein
VDALRLWLIDALAALAPDVDAPADDDTPLADQGFCLDSLGLLALIGAIEEHTGVVISEDEITEAHFGTVGRLLGFLAARGAAAR